MDIKLVNRGEEGELILAGRLDTKNADEASAVFLQVADRFKDVTLNMQDMKYISSAGLRALKKLYMKVRGNGGELSVTNVAPYVAEVFEMTGFAEMFSVK
ncbi:STAS domain-containing protein [Ruminococcus sp. NK3A76]|uniref:STAS domain-containing protein n=1 Tax=Ruminococcus sp. NK3A76 TaxID=877411 RepID=UPI00048FBB38|nr:STAS domain-containing protein [Ruminococcus sp. NK3A76]